MRKKTPDRPNKKAPPKTPRTPKKIKNAKKEPSKPLHWFKKFLIYSVVFSVFILAAYLGYLDYTVRHQFEGKRWSIPARVYASPLELYPGLNLSAKEFEDTLHELNYRQDYQLSSEGTFYKKGQQITLKSRQFKFWDKAQTSTTLRVNFNGNELLQLKNLSGSQDLAIFRLDPIQIGSFYPSHKEDRILIRLTETPDALIHGLLATEDRDYYQHYGVSAKAIARALWTNVKAGSVVQGGSTITQQLVKNFYLSPKKSLWRKLNEAFMALILEYRFSKNEILEAYLNEIYLGQNGASSVHGFGLASQFYFGQTLNQLALHDVATLVALVRGPSYYDPRKYPERCTQRRNLVLDEMQKQGFITPRQAQEAQRQALKVIPRVHHSINRYPAFLDRVKRELRREYKEADLTEEGLKIFTTLDVRAQNTLEKTLPKKLAQLEKKPHISQLQTAVIITHRENGEIVALSGGRNPQDAGFNRALDAVRPIGSLIKPAIYLTALKYPERYTVSTLIDDTAIALKDQKGRVWRPQNYDKKEHGKVKLMDALTYSYNLAAVRVGLDVGIAKVAKTLRHLGIDRSFNLYPSLLLGALPLTPLEVAQMYQTLAGDGFATPLRSIRAVLSQKGERLQNYPYTIKQTVDPDATYLVNTLLQNVMRKGTGRSAYLYLPQDQGLAGKTGTTNDYKDSWFAGFTGDYLSVVWVGRDDNLPAGLTGGSGALQIWIKLMQQLSTQPVSLIPSDNIQSVWIDPDNGLKASETCPNAVQYPYIVGSEPQQTSPCLDSTVNRASQWFQQFFQ